MAASVTGNNHASPSNRHTEAGVSAGEVGSSDPVHPGWRSTGDITGHDGQRDVDIFEGQM